MIALDVADLALIASHTLGLDTGQALHLVDVAAAENVLAEAQQGGESAGPALRAAALLHALARQRPLRRGNQQVALAAMLQFLAINGWDMRCWLPGGSTPADSPTGTSRQSTWPWNRPGNWATTTSAPSICSSACSARETALPPRC